MNELEVKTHIERVEDALRIGFRHEADWQSVKALLSLAREVLDGELVSRDALPSVEELNKIIQESQDCPNAECGNKGWYIGSYHDREICTREMAIDSGCPELEGSIVLEAQQEQVQCEFCYTNKYSKFNLATALSERLQGGNQ